MPPSKVYVWWPTPREVPIVESSTRGLAKLLVGELVFALILMSPPVVAATGVPAKFGAGIIGVHAALVALFNYVIVPFSSQRPRLRRVLLFTDLLTGYGLAVAWVVAAGTPGTPLWMALIAYACVLGAAQELEASYGYLIATAIAPFATVPFFAAQDHPWAQILGGAVLCSAFSALMYNQLATHAAENRQARAEHAAELEAARARVAQLESERLARDLHDSVGSSLGVVALYSELLDRDPIDPATLRSAASALRDAAAGGLDELRAILAALTPEAATVGRLGDQLRTFAQRSSASGKVQIDVGVTSGADATVSGPVRLALVRVVQEGLHNAVRHGSAKRVTIEVGARDGRAQLSIADDGLGFESDAITEGRGLPGMRTRARELGGACTIEAARGKGARVTIDLPLGGA